MAMIQVRPSRLPLAHECPSSLQPAEHPLGGGSEYSDLGNAQHYGGGSVALGKPYDVVEIARSYSVDEDELRLMMFLTEKAWNYLRQWFPSPRVECRVSSELLGDGTADVLHHDGDTCAINDWKSGRVERTYYWQMWGYAWNAWKTFGMPRSGYIDSAITWVRTGRVEHHAFSDRELDAMADQHSCLESKIGKVYAPGECCGFCPRRHECDAYRDYISASACAIEPIRRALETGASTGLTSEQLARLYPRAKMLQKALEAYGQMLHAALVDGKRLPTGDGRVLYLDDFPRTELDSTLALLVLRANGWPEDKIAEVIEVSKRKAVEVVEAEARKTKIRGAIKLAREALEKSLADAGAVHKTIHQRLVAAKE